MSAVIETTFANLAQAALGVQDFNNFNIGLLYNLIDLLLKKLGFQDEKIQISGSVGHQVQHLLKSAQQSSMRLADKVISISCKLKTLEDQIQQLNEKFVSFCNNESAIHYNIPQWEYYGNPCEDLYTCETKNEIACTLVQNKDFLKKLTRFISNPILERTFEIEARFDELRLYITKFVKKSEEGNANKHLIRNILNEIEQLQKKNNEDNVLFKCTMAEIQEMLDAKVDKLHMPALKKYIKDHFDEMEKRILNLETISGCPRAAGIILDNVTCLSCGQRNVGAEIESKNLPLATDKVIKKTKIHKKIISNVYCNSRDKKDNLHLLQKIQKFDLLAPTISTLNYVSSSLHKKSLTKSLTFQDI